MTGRALWIAVGVMLLSVADARAGPSDVDARACLALMDRFDVFDEQAEAPTSDRSGAAAGETSYASSLRRIRRAAAQGNIKAEAALGDMYLEGRCGLKKSMDKALELGARAGGYFGIAMMYMDRKKPVDAYKWFTIGLLKDPWYTARDIRLTLRQGGVEHPTKDQVQMYLDRVATGKQVIRARLQLLKTMANLSDEQVSKARNQARAWLKAHP